MPDRSTYRMYEDARLIEEAKYDPNRELAIVLGERLDEVIRTTEIQIEDERERAADFERDANQLDDKIYELQHEIDKLELMISERDRIIDELKETK